MIKYIFLSSNFYAKYDEINYPEIARKKDRPYIMLLVKVNGLDFAIPLRSSIKRHNNAFFTDKINHCGVDYSKAVIVPDASYIDNSRRPKLRSNEHNALKGQGYIIKTGLERYIKKYRRALKEQHIPRNKIFCQCSTLQYFHSELNIDT